MFFTKVGRVVAWLAFVVGALRMAIAFGVIMVPEHFPYSSRYLGSRTGEEIDKGLAMLVFGIGLGILTEISRYARPPRD